MIVNLLGVKLEDRPAFFATLLLRLHESRARSGRPHWILVDEAHHLLPADWHPAPQLMTEGMTSMMFVTVHPEQLARALLPRLDVVVSGRVMHRKSGLLRCAAVSQEAVAVERAGRSPSRKRRRTQLQVRVRRTIARFRISAAVDGRHFSPDPRQHDQAR